jgi:hypothetical protein
MTPKAPEGGRATGKSFKGAFMYLQHDKRLEGETVRTTDERVAWQTFRNLATDNPDAAWRVMAATARQQDALKLAAGGSGAGQKSDQVVFHYSLAWHPDEKVGLSRSEMLRAADESIRALGAEGYQAAIIAHNDTKHPHVHVVINRVNPETGKMLDIWNYKKRLSKWALAYERERGHIWCQEREENWKRRDLGEVFSHGNGESWHKRQEAEPVRHANDNDRRKIYADQKAKDADLLARSEAQNKRHRDEWRALSEGYRDRKASILKSTQLSPAPFREIKEKIAEQYRPAWRDLYRQQWREQRAFERREKHLAGKLENAIAAVRHAQALGRDTSRGFLAMAFNFLVNSKARASALAEVHNEQKKSLKAEQKEIVDKAIARLKSGRSQALGRNREQFAIEREALIVRQDVERAELSRQWQERKEERARAFALAGRVSEARRQAKAAPESQDINVRREFTTAAKPKRTRSRTRRRDVDED